MANAFYAKQSKTCAVFAVELARFLMDDLAGFTGPATGWTVIEAYSSAAVDTHEIPADATDMDSLAADNGWRTGTLVINDYIVLESASVANKFRVGIEYQANDTIRFILDFKAGFATGQENADMTTAGNWVTTKSGTIDFDTNNAGAAGNWSIVADEDLFQVFYEDGTIAHMNYIYCGKYDDALPEDQYNTVIYTQCATPAMVSGAGMGAATAFDKLSIADDSTKVSAISFMHVNTLGSLESEDNNLLKDPTTSKQRFLDIVIGTTTGAHQGVWGKLRSCWYTNKNVVATGQATLGTLAYLAFGDTATYGKLVIPWDTQTAY